MSELPPITQEPIIHVDMTPNNDLPARILRAYLENCNCKWEVSGLSESARLIYDKMNEAQEERKEILETAIRRLNPQCTCSRCTGIPDVYSCED